VDRRLWRLGIAGIQARAERLAERRKDLYGVPRARNQTLGAALQIRQCANIWVANYDGNTVTKLAAETAALVDTFPVGSFPYGVAFDGANIWVANSTSSNVSKL